MLNIPTKINKGTVEITSNVALIKAGDKVGASEATLLAKLGIKPFSYGLIVEYVSLHNNACTRHCFLMGSARSWPYVVSISKGCLTFPCHHYSNGCIPLSHSSTPAEQLVPIILSDSPGLLISH